MKMAYEEVQATPLSTVADAFEEIADIVENGKEELRLKAFCDACALVSVLFNSLGLAFKFAEMEYCSKVLFLFSFSLSLLILFRYFDHYTLVFFLSLGKWILVILYPICDCGRM